MGEIPSTMVPKYYEMNPDTEDLIFNGDTLINGMVVLLTSTEAKQELDQPGRWFGKRKLTPSEKHRARVCNRWCRVTELDIVGNHVRFVGVYADGTKHPRASSAMNSWLVRFDSLDDLTS